MLDFLGAYLVTLILPASLMVAAVVFLVALLGNYFSFGNRLVNAVVTALVAAALGAVVLMLAGEQHFTLPMAGAFAATVFGVDLVANLLNFKHRAVSALITCVLFWLIWGAWLVTLLLEIN